MGTRSPISNPPPPLSSASNNGVIKKANRMFYPMGIPHYEMLPWDIPWHVLGFRSSSHENFHGSPPWISQGVTASKGYRGGLLIPRVGKCKPNIPGNIRSAGTIGDRIATMEKCGRDKRFHRQYREPWHCSTGAIGTLPLNYLLTPLLTPEALAPGAWPCQTRRRCRSQPIAWEYLGRGVQSVSILLLSGAAPA